MLQRPVLLTLAAFGCVSDSLVSAPPAVTMPFVSEQTCPPEVIEAPTRDGQKATAVVRKPPGKGPFPAVVLLGGNGTQRPGARRGEPQGDLPARTAVFALSRGELRDG